jgi:hypothetical protein
MNSVFVLSVCVCVMPISNTIIKTNFNYKEVRIEVNADVK